MSEKWDGNLKEGIIELLAKKFFEIFKEKFEENKEKNILVSANEGSKEWIEENLNLISDEWLKDIDKVTIYDEEELRKIFINYYKKLNLEDDIEEELWQRFLLFARRSLDKYNKSLSIGEKRILQKTREIQEDLKELVDKNELKRLAQNQSELQKRLIQNIDVPYIDFNKLYGVEISDYDSKYIFFENTFDFDETEYRDDELIKWDVYTFRFLVKNIGHTNIEKITIENFCVMYAAEIDDPETGLYVLPIVKHNKKIERCINILPNAEEFIQIIMTKQEEELSGEDQIANFLKYYDNNRLYVSFDMKLKGKEERTYKYILFLSKIRVKNSKGINGMYTVDYSVFTEK